MLFNIQRAKFHYMYLLSYIMYHIHHAWSYYHWEVWLLIRPSLATTWLVGFVAWEVEKLYPKIAPRVCGKSRDLIHDSVVHDLKFMFITFKLCNFICLLSLEPDSEVMYCTCSGIGDPFAIIMNKVGRETRVFCEVIFNLHIML